MSDKLPPGVSQSDIDGEDGWTKCACCDGGKNPPKCGECGKQINCHCDDGMVERE